MIFGRKKTAGRRARRAGDKRTMNYYRSNPAGQEPGSSKRSAKNKRLPAIVGRAGNYLVVVILTALLIYTVILGNQPEVTVNDTSYRAKQAYENAATAEFQSLKNRNKITLDKKEIETSLKRQFPEISSVEVAANPLSRTAKVKLQVYSPSFFLISGGRKLVINEEGLIAGESTQLPQIKNLPEVSDLSDFSTDPGSRVLSRQAVGFINDVIDQSSKSDIKLQSLSLPRLSQELHLRTTDSSYYVKFFLGGNSSRQLGQFLAARKHFSKSRQIPREYLDVRVEGKLFYK